MTAYTFTIPGVPIAKKRPRFVRKGSYVGTYNCQETEEGRFVLSVMDQIRTKGYADALPLPSGTPVNLICAFYMPLPKSAPKRVTEAVRSGETVWHTKTPDLDNLLKFVKDCLNGVVWADDSQVISVEAYKRYGTEPTTKIWISLE